MQKLMTDKIIITDKNKFPDRFVQPDSTHTDKKENIICHRFAFLKISKIRFAAHLPAPAHRLTPSQAKELQLY
jgi:hypothetical protein